MATSNFQTQKFLLSISLTLFLLLLSKGNSTETTSFTFTKFVPHQKNLILQGDALVTSKGKLQLTKVEGGKPIYYSLGRALYSAPVHVWDSTTGHVASFVTTFSFVINAVDKNKTADGIAFFLAPVDTQPKKPGGFLGLFSDKYYNKSNQIVAVEFDTYYNAEFDDPRGPHIGIDVNSIKSIKTTLWGLANGQVATVVISYQASSKTLTASLVHPSHQTSHIVSSVVDLKNVLPEFVKVGLSGASGLSKDYIETHDVHSWSFDSKLPDCNVHALEINNTHLSSHVLHDSV